MSDIFNKYTEMYDVESFNKNYIEDDKEYYHKVKDEDILFNMNDDVSTKTYDTVYSRFGSAGYMCPNCYNIQHIKTKIANNATLLFTDQTDEDIDEIESNNIDLSVNYDVKLKCPVCRYYNSQLLIDDAIADVVGILNIKGYYTSWACEGHNDIINNKIIDPCISFSKLQQEYPLKLVSKIESYIESTLPLSWYIYRRLDGCSYTYRDSDTMMAVLKRRFIPITYIDTFKIKADFYNKEEALKDILKWARSLKDLKMEDEL